MPWHWEPKKDAANCEIEVKKPRTINKTLKGKKYYNSNKERTINKTHGQATKSLR